VVAYRRVGLARREAEAGRATARLASSCEGATTPVLELPVQPEHLTAREREIALLAARGLSNRSIAEQLVVSVRTIENHLQQAYNKLGVRGRSELADALGIAESPP